MGETQPKAEGLLSIFWDTRELRQYRLGVLYAQKCLATVARSSESERRDLLGHISEDTCPVPPPQAPHCSDMGLNVARTVNRFV
jgi:hypothetical protein